MSLPVTKDSNGTNNSKLIEKIKKFPSNIWHKLWDAGKEDPRRVIHAVKMGIALTLVTLLYLLGPLVKIFGPNAMWAVMTVCLVLEFTAGATLYKGLNRGLGTVCAGMLSLFVEFFAGKAGHVVNVVVVGIVVFLVGAGATFVRFIPYIKKNYDYGVIIFLLTFNLITISAFDVDNLLGMARDRLYTIGVGSAICIIMSLFILPNWSGQDLERSMVDKLEALAKSIEACVHDYFVDEDIRDEEKSSRYPIYKGYRMVLDSKSTDEAQALFASWEPRHSAHRYPWERYVELGTTLRHFAYTAVALHGCLESSIQAPQSLRSQFKDPCIRLATEVSKVLNQLAIGIKNHRHCPPNVLSDQLHGALQDLDSAIKSQPRILVGPNQSPYGSYGPPSPLQSEKADVPATLLNLKSRRLEDQKSRRVDDLPKETAGHRVLRPQLSMIVIRNLEFSDALPFAAFASLLVEMVARLDLVIEEVEALGKAACFKKYSKRESKKRSCTAAKKHSPKWPGRVVPQGDE